MKRVLFVVTFCILAAPTLLADQITIERVSGYFSGNGGEFTVTPIGWSPAWDAYVEDVTKNVSTTNDTFQTFCVEYQEYIDVGTSYHYNVTFSDRAIKGGLETNEGDPLSVGAAWLYYEFAKKTLNGYNYTGNRATSAGELQTVIWWLEDERSLQNPTNNQFYNLLLDKFGSWDNAKKDNFSGGVRKYPVMVMNVWGGTSYKQDQLVVVPEPGTLMLVGLGIGLLGLASKLRRRHM